MTQSQTHERVAYREIADLSVSERHRLLAAERRRILLTILSSHSPPIHLETLAKKVAERDTSVDTVDSGIVDGMKKRLHHTHLPMMADMGILETTSETNQIEFAESWTY